MSQLSPTQLAIAIAISSMNTTDVFNFRNERKEKHEYIVSLRLKLAQAMTSQGEQEIEYAKLSRYRYEFTKYETLILTEALAIRASNGEKSDVIRTPPKRNRLTEVNTVTPPTKPKHSL